ncbi:MAG: FAD-binding protein, partial [Candidatus Altiarchaeales archaeon]|nr:FAD-binding protein [Candidatus Altiarchaeales archaeon]
MTDGFDAVIVGAGPAGLFCAHRLAEDKLRVLVVDLGSDVSGRVCPRIKEGECRHCKPCNIMCGAGGAGLWSDGILNLRYDVGGDLTEFTDQENARRLIEKVDALFCDMGAPEKLYGLDEKENHELKVLCAAHGVEFKKIIQRHMGSENTPRIIGNMVKDLRERGVEFMFNAKAEDLVIEGGVVGGVLLSDGREINAEYVVLCPGRSGASWANFLFKKHGIAADFGPVDVGVRVEVSSLIMEDVVKVNRDPKFHIKTETYDDFVRTFCTNHEGYVVEESYDSLVGVNGHSM